MSKIELLERKKQQINAQIQVLKAKESVKKRKLDTRKKILLGGIIMKLLREQKPITLNTQSDLLSLLDQHLKRNTDRELFGLNSKEK